jgi:PAS domain S-box-containing protein
MSLQSKYKNLIDSTIDKVIIVVSKFGEIVYLEGKFNSFKFNTDDLIGKNIQDLILEKDSPFTYPILNKSNQELSANLKVTASKKQAVHLKIVYDAKEEMYVMYIKPSSAQYSERRGLEQLKEFYENLLNHLPVDVVVFSTSHRYLYINKIALSDESKRNWIIGKTDEEYAQKYKLSANHIKGRKETFQQVIETKNIIQYEEEFEGSQPDGSSKWILRHFKPIYNNKSEIEFVLGFGLDISDRKKAELEILRNLEKQTQLNQLKNQFVSTISHEFRTPLATIRGSIDLINIYIEKKHLEIERVQRFINTINNEVYNLNNLINEVLMIGRHEAKKTPVIFDKFNYLVLIENIVNYNFPFLENRKITIEKLTTIVDTYFDQKLMFHVFSNILSNSVKYSQKDIKVILSQTDNETRLIFQDFGIGIPENEQEKLFHSFFRASNSINYQGTGLGLLIVKNFIDLHQGSIEVKSKLEQGAIIELSIPHNPKKKH